MSNIPVPVPDQELYDDHAIRGFELLRHIRKTPTVLYGIFVEVARQFYSNADNRPIGTPIKVWSPDPQQTAIWIDTELRWEDEHPEMRPAIYVSLSPITYTSLSGRTDGLTGMVIEDAEYTFARSGKGTVSFIHVGGTDAEACTLGDATLDYLDAFGMVIRDDFCFTSFALTERVAKRLMPKESKERTASVVTCAFEFQDKWVLKLESEKLKVFILNAGQRLLANGIVG